MGVASCAAIGEGETSMKAPPSRKLRECFVFDKRLVYKSYAKRESVNCESNHGRWTLNSDAKKFLDGDHLFSSITAKVANN